MPDISSVVCLSKYCVQYSYVVLLIIPLLILLWFIIQRNFVFFADKAEQQSYQRTKKTQRLMFFIIRGTLFALLLFAIASPFILETKTVKGNPRITVLIDNSTSMNLFEHTIGRDLISELKGTIPVQVRTIAAGDESALGDGILNNVERDENVLVVTDGSSNEGKLLGDIMLLATTLNATVSTLSMKPVRSDVGVTIDGPLEAIRDTTEVFQIHVENVGESISYTLQVKYDNEIVIARQASGSGTFTFSKRVTEGYHRISAELLNVGSNDYFSKNNEYFKTLKVVPRPKILFVTNKQSPMVAQLDDIYDTTTVGSIPNNLDEYLAVVLNDLPHGTIAPHVSRLSDYVSDGNGLFVIGGQQSYDRGGYKGTLLETLLPVKIGSGEDSEESDAHIVIIIDVSGTTGVVYNTATRQNEVRDYDLIIKAQAVSVIDSLDEKANVGVLVIGTRNPTGTVVELAPIAKLEDRKDDIIKKIASIDRSKVGGQTDLRIGIDKANQMLRNVAGGKNVIIISDGRGLAPAPQKQVLESMRNAASRGVKAYVAGVGVQDDQEFDFLSDLAQTGSGTYFPLDASQKLEILFGDTESKDEQNFLNKLVLLDTTHFITYNQSLDAIVSGYNYLIPKPASRLLVTTNKKIPVMVAWRFGLGRVVSLGTDDGTAWGGELLLSDNSKVVTKGINWAIGDLSRKKNFDVKIRDVSLGDTLTINVISNTLPEHADLNFVKSDVNVYSARFLPDETGFYNFFGADAAVNYKHEFSDLGVNTEFTTLVEQTQGQVFNEDDTEEILEFIREKSKRLKVNTTDFKWPFILLVIILLLVEILLRRIWENQSY